MSETPDRAMQSSSIGPDSRKEQWLSVLGFLLFFVPFCAFLSRDEIGTLLTPPPTATPTPFPSYVAGEETFAFDSYMTFFRLKVKEGCIRPHYDETAYGHGFSSKYEPGRATYLGDGYWRFRIALFNAYEYGYDAEHGVPDIRESYFEGTYEVRSLSGSTWGYDCVQARSGAGRGEIIDDFSESADYDPIIDSGPGD